MATPEEHLAKAERFLATATWALSDGDQDSCVSRAAYAAHHACLALLLRNGAPQSVEEASKPRIQSNFARLIRERYRELDSLRYPSGAKSLQRSLQNLWDLRNAADYRVQVATPRQASEVFEFVSRLVREVGATLR